jgi:hypothetical protein
MNLWAMCADSVALVEQPVYFAHHIEMEIRKGRFGAGQLPVIKFRAERNLCRT